MIRTKRTTRKMKARPVKMATSSTMMMTTTKKKTRSNRYVPPAWHPAVLVPPSKSVRSRKVHLARWMAILSTAGLVASWGAAFGQVQEAVPPPPSSAAAPQASAVTPGKPAKKRYRHANDFLIRGTVFTDKALSFPGVQLRIRRAGEKKFRWESYTNARGEFAVRVHQGTNYEMVIHARGFTEQTRAVDAKAGVNEESLVFRMQPATGGKG